MGYLIGRLDGEGKLESHCTMDWKGQMVALGGLVPFSRPIGAAVVRRGRSASWSPLCPDYGNGGPDLSQQCAVVTVEYLEIEHRVLSELARRVESLIVQYKVDHGAVELYLMKACARFETPNAEQAVGETND